jgi:hypothetical protein
MKTQLLEDIGQSASPMWPAPVAKATAPKVPPPPAQEAAPPVVAARSGLVWRYKIAAEPAPPIETVPEAPAPAPAPAPALAPPIDPLPEAPPPPAPLRSPLDTVHPVIGNPPAGATGASPASAPHEQQANNLFDFSLPPTSPNAVPDLFGREPTWFDRWGRRGLVAGSSLVACAIVVAGGLWLLREYRDDESLALVASTAKLAPTTAKATVLAPKVLAVAPPDTVSPVVPPLVLLPREPIPAVQEKVKPESNPVVTERTVPTPKPTRVREQREPVQQPRYRTATTVPPEVRAEPPVTMSATLAACREHGYSPAQCVKRGCRVTRFGFVCTGK